MSSNERIPFLDLPALHKPLKEEFLNIMGDAIDTARFIGGPNLDTFEKGFAEYCKAGECIGVASGTDALVLALRALGISCGDLVVTVPNTFIATTEAISQVGARIAFVDIDPETDLMSVASLESFLKNTAEPVKAVIPVHLYGQTVDMDGIMELAKKYDFAVLEDACQAHGAEYKGRRAGSLGHAAAFSFYPGKNLGACGEGGAVTTNDTELAKMVRVLRDHGQSQKYHHEVEGYNGRLHAIQAGFLNAKLPYLEGWNESRRDSSAKLDEAFADCKRIRPVKVKSDNLPSRHLYVVHVDDREALGAHLDAAGIDSALHYPVPLHLQKCYAHMNLKEGSFPKSEESARSLLSLPMFPDMTDEQVQRIINAILDYEQK